MKKRTSNQIKNFLIILVVILLITLIGLIVFLLNVKIDNNTNNIRPVESQTENSQEKQTENVSLENYELIKKSSDETIQAKLAEGKLILKIIDEFKFKEIYPNSIIDTSNEIEVAIHENKLEDVIIGKIRGENYLLAITDKGSIGVMKIEDAVENDVFRIKNTLISFKNPVARLTSVNTNEEIKVEETVIVILTDGNKYDLADIVE